MTLRHWISHAPLGVALLCGCHPAPIATVGAAPAIADTLRMAMRDYMAALRALDPESAIAVYARDSCFSVHTPSASLGYDSVVAIHRAAAYTRFDGDWDTIAVTVVAPDSAVAIGQFWQRTTDSAGTTTAFRGTVVWTWVRRGPGWRVIDIRAVARP
jgi:uncharacterized protein (TIGR02246 family)